MDRIGALGGQKQDHLRHGLRGHPQAEICIRHSLAVLWSIERAGKDGVDVDPLVNEPGACLVKRPDDRGAEIPATTGHQNDLIVEIDHLVLLEMGDMLL